MLISMNPSHQGSAQVSDSISNLAADFRLCFWLATLASTLACVHDGRASYSAQPDLLVLTGLTLSSLGVRLCAFVKSSGPFAEAIALRRVRLAARSPRAAS